MEAPQLPSQERRYESQRQALAKHFPRAKLYLHGSTCQLFGVKEDDANCLDYAMMTLEELEPQTLVLGGVSQSDLAHYKLGDLRFQFDPCYQLDPLTPDRLVARSKLNTLFQKQMENVPHLFYEDET